MIEKIETVLKESIRGNDKLYEAMSYSLLSSGKRLRPWLVFESAFVASSQLSRKQVWDFAVSSAIAIEYVHTYSLIHDDLPAMDNDDMRRGKPTSHRQFDEATAILAGDAFLSDAFFYLSKAKVKASLQCAELANAIGSRGMILGQMKDIDKITAKSEDDFLEIYRLKTGKLFECACVLGAMSVDALPEIKKVLKEFGMSYGVAFQLVDDWMDQSEAVEFLGPKRVFELANQHILSAINVLESLRPKTDRLIELTNKLLLKLEA